MKNGLPSWRGWKNRAKMDGENRKNRRKTGEWQEYGYVLWAAAQGRPYKGKGKAGRTQFAPTEAGIYVDITVQAGGFWPELRSPLRWRRFMWTLRFKPANFGQNCVRPYGGGGDGLCEGRGIHEDGKHGRLRRRGRNDGVEEGQGPGERSSPLRWREFMRTLRFKPADFGQNRFG